MRTVFGSALLACAMTFATGAAVAFQDVLDTPSSVSELAPARMLIGVTNAGDKLVTVGQRGHLLISTDQGKRWLQSAVPLSSDLVAVHFPTPAQGWVVGHDGVVIHTDDGGKTWVKQLDGTHAAQLLLHYFEKRAQTGYAASDALATEAKRFVADGPDKPFLDVWFENERTGWIVGAFNLIFRTLDGGNTWEPWFDKTDNPKLLHLYAIRGVGSDLYIAGEQGLLLKLDKSAGRFRAIALPYRGSLFGLVGTPNALVVFGLRGNAFRSRDGGEKWEKLETGDTVALTGGAALPDGRIVLVSQAGHVFVSTSDGESLRQLTIDHLTPLAGVAAAGGELLALVGLRGVRMQRVDKP